MQFRSLVSSILLTLLFAAPLFAEKPEQNRQLEILDNEVEETYRFSDMRVSKESGTPIAIYGVDYPVKADTPENMARQYLLENAALLRINDLDNLEHFATLETPGGFRVRFQQMLDGYKVYKSTIVVSLNKNNDVVFYMSTYKPLAKLANKAPVVAAKAAQAQAKQYLSIEGRLNRDIQETVVYYNKGVTRLAHKVSIIPAEKMFGDWEVMVDAITGEMFRVEDKARYNGGHKRVDGTGQVFDPDPLTRAGATYGGNYVDNNDADNASLNNERIAVTLLDITEDNGTFSLDGPYAVISDTESPFGGTYDQASSDWSFTRSEQGFEAANVYYHIDQSMRYINETLGFTVMPYQYTGGARVDPHGLGGADNSHYLSDGTLAWGEGGVDDSEDPDVIWHELGHGIHDWITNGGLSQNEGLSEGIADYWANSKLRSTGFWTPADPQYFWTFQWDGHNEFWNGRVTNINRTHPSGLGGGVHADGEIIATAMMAIWDDIGRDASDKNFLEGLSMTNSGAGQTDLAQAMIQADVNLFGGANLSSMQQRFTERGYQITIPTPQIQHVPLTDIEDVNGPYVVNASIAAGGAINEAKLFWGTGGTFANEVNMTNLSGNDWTASITGSGSPATYEYYIFTSDANGLSSTLPAGAPGNFYSFVTGADAEAPVVTHAPLGDQALVSWPANVSAEITDNLSVASAEVSYSINGGTGSTFALVNGSGDTWSADFPISSGSISEGDVISYSILATDGSSNGNQTVDPPSGSHDFTIVASRGLILVIDDDASTQPLRVVSEKGTYERNLTKSPFGLAADLISNGLNDLGFTSSVESVSSTDPATWDSYNLIIHSSGINVDPVADATYRAALENWVSSDPSNKLLVEGGEVGYDAASTPGYPAFASMVIHTDDWDADNAGPFNLLSSQSTHPMVTTPNQLPNSFGIDYSNWPSEDAVNQIGGAYVLYEPGSNPGLAGIAIYDNDTNVEDAQIVYIAANYAEFSNQADAKLLLENAVSYLLAVPTGIGDDNTTAVPQEYALNANYPNPFNPTTTISYDVRETSNVRVTVFNMLGQEVRTLVNTRQAAGSHEIVWDATNNLGEAVSSGIYLYQLQAGDFVQSRKMVLLK